MTRCGDNTIAPGFEVPVAVEPPTQPAMPPIKPVLPKIERATVVEVRPGDVLVFEVDRSMTDKEMASFKESVREAHSEDVRVMVLEYARFAGVIRREDAAQPAQSTRATP